MNKGRIASLKKPTNRTVVGTCVMALSWSFAIAQTNGVPISDSNTLGNASGDKALHLQKFEVTGRPTMGIKAGIACDHMLLGNVVQVIVNDVTKGGRGSKLGICDGDEILAINGEKLIGKKRSEVYALMQQMSQGREGNIDLRRKGVAEPLHFAWELVSSK